MDFFWFLISVFAVYRLARIISKDTICRPFRSFVGRRAVNNKMLFWVAELIHCPFCVGVWLAVPFAFYFYDENSIAMVFAIAGGQTFLECLGNAKV